MSDLSWLNPTPHAIAVYASRPLSPVATQHSLPSGRYPLPGPDFHRLDRTSLRLAHSLDHLVGEDQQRRWYRQAQRLGGLEIDREPEPRRLHGRQISGFCAVENSSGVGPDLPIPLRQTVAVGDQAAGCGELTPHIDRWDRITCRERNEVVAAVGIKYIALDDQAAGVPLGERGEGGVDLGFLACGENENRPPDLPCRGLDVLFGFSRVRNVWVDEYADRRVLRHQFAEKLQAFREQRARGHHDAGDIAARPVEAGDHARLQDDIAAQENDWNGCGGGGGRFHHGRAAGRSDHGDAAVEQISHQSRQSIVAAFRPAVFDEYVATLNIAGFLQALAERGR